MHAPPFVLPSIALAAWLVAGPAAATSSSAGSRRSAGPKPTAAYRIPRRPSTID